MHANAQCSCGFQQYLHERFFCFLLDIFHRFWVSLSCRQERDAAALIPELRRMLTISKPSSAGQAQTYHAREFSSEQQNYWSRNHHAFSEWRGKLAAEWGLHGHVSADRFARLSEGQHPDASAQLVKHQPARTYENEYGKQITSAEHRAGWDATFSAPKSVSLTALVGGDFRVREAHRESVR